MKDKHKKSIAKYYNMEIDLQRTRSRYFVCNTDL